MSKVELDTNKCLGCGACVAIAPDNFDFDDEGISKIISEEVSEKTIEALEACPVEAITVCGCEDCKCEDCECEHSCECGCEDGCNCDDDCECGCK